MYLCNCKNQMYTCPVYNWSINFSVILAPHLHPAVSTQTCFMFVESSIQIPLVLETPDAHDHDCFCSLKQVAVFGKSPMTSDFMIIYFINHGLYKLVKVCLFKSLIVIESLIWCDAGLGQCQKAIYCSVVKCVYLVIAINSLWKCWSYSNFFLKRVSHTWQAIPKGTDSRE